MATDPTPVSGTGPTLIFAAPWENSRAVAQLPRQPERAERACRDGLVSLPSAEAFIRQDGPDPGGQPPG